MIRRALIDTGPLVALFSKRDSNHDLCMVASKEIEAPYFTSWPVMTETAWLLRDYPIAISELFQGIENGLLKVLDLDDRFVRWCRIFFERYEDIGVQLADASLVYLSERERIVNVFTLDRRDFAIYRTTRNRALTIIP